METNLYDIHRMRGAASEAGSILEEIRQELQLAEKIREEVTDHRKWRRDIRELERVCRGYEGLVHALTAAANVYAASKAAAAELVDF